MDKKYVKPQGRFVVVIALLAVGDEKCGGGTAAAGVESKRVGKESVKRI